MANSVELPKLPIFADVQQPATERDSLPFSSVPIAHPDERSTIAAAAQASDFEAYLNRRSILRLALYKKKTFDPAAEILRRSVYKPIKIKRDR